MIINIIPDMKERIILGVQLKQGSGQALKLQQIFSKFGCVIKTRLGLNDSDGEGGTQQGLIILELQGDQSDCQHLINELHRLEDADVQQMNFL